MQRRFIPLVALGLTVITAGVVADQTPAGGGAPPQSQQAQQGKPPRQTVLRGKAVTIRGQEISIGAVGTPPPLMFKEPWKMVPFTPPLNDEKRRWSQVVVTNPQLELKVYGPNAKELLAYEHEGLVDLWTGISAPIVVMLRDKTKLIELPRLARMRVTARTNGLHKLYPVVKLADGTFLVGDGSVDTEGDFAQGEILFNEMTWFWLDPERVLVMREVLEPDLSRVDEIGVADLAPPGGHTGAGWVNISTIELYANAIPR